MNKMLFCGEFPRDKNPGGGYLANTYALQYLCSQNKFEVVALSPIFRGENTKLSDPRITFLPTKYLRSKSFGDLLCRIDFARQVKKYLKNTGFKPDIIVVGQSQYLATQFGNLPKILLIHGSSKRKYPLLRLLKNFYSSVCDFFTEIDEKKCLYDESVKKIVVNADFVKDLITSDFNLSPAIVKKIEIARIGCEVSRLGVGGLDKQAAKTWIAKKMGIPTAATDLLLIFVGGFAEHKGQRELIAVMPNLLKQHPETRLLLLGKDAGDKEYCSRLVSALELQDNVFILENLPDSEVGKMLVGSDICVAASLEGYGIALAEAMTLGLPLIVYNRGAGKELFIDGKQGFVVNSDEEFISRVASLAKNTDALKAMSVEAKKYAEDNHGTEQFGKAIERMSLEIISEKNSAN